MELKKSPKADLENKRQIFLELGLVIAIAACLLSFKTNSKVSKSDVFDIPEGKTLIEDLPPVTRPEQTPPEALKLPKVVELIKIVDDLTEVNGEPDFGITEADSKTAIHVQMQNVKKEVETIEEPIVYFAEEMPEFPGGQKALLAFLGNSIKYPAVAAETGVMGKVIVNFVVNTDGSICNTKVIRSVDPALDKEALRVVNGMPKWKPGKQAGKFVRVSYSVPISFVLN